MQGSGPFASPAPFGSTTPANVLVLKRESAQRQAPKSAAVRIRTEPRSPPQFFVRRLFCTFAAVYICN